MGSSTADAALENLLEGPYSSEDETLELYDVPWSLYCQLRNIGANRKKRMLYLDGDLHVTTFCSPSHGYTSRLIAVLISHWTLQRDIPYIGAGSTTFRREDLAAGLEPDESFYIERLDRIQWNNEVDLTVEPMPDLIVEVDVTDTTREKLSRYAGFGAPEIWVWCQGLHVLVLDDDTYREVPESRVLAGFPIAKAAELVGRPGFQNWNVLADEFIALMEGQSKP